METSRLDAWLERLEPLAILDEASLSLARERVRDVGAGLPRLVIETLATIATELTRNQLVHARGGYFAARRIESAGVPGLELIAADDGPGITDLARALQDGGSTSGGLGSGLAGAHRLADELDFDIRLREGTCIRARKFADRVPYRSEVAILGRPYDVEPVSGDDAIFLRTDDALVVAVVDGLGHGPAAHEAAATAIATLHAQASQSPETILQECGKAVIDTRGAVMAVARIDLTRREIAYAGLGDINTRIYRPHDSYRFSSRPGFLGKRDQQVVKVHAESIPLRAGDVFLMFSDGILTRMDLAEEFQLLREHPVLVAEHVMERFRRTTDDAIVLVTR